MIPEFPRFKTLELSDKEEVEKITAKYPPYSDFNFVSMWCWDIKGEMRISLLNNNLVVKFTDYLTGNPFFSFLGDNMVNETAEILLDLCKKEGLKPILKLVSEESVKGMDFSKFSVQEDRDNFDYVYNINALSKYEGKKYATHRNLLSRFSNHNPNTIIKVIPLGLAQKDILELSKKWKISKIGKHSDIQLKNEFDAINRIFDITSDNLISICVFSENGLIAYSIYELLEGDYVLCHFAKSNIDFTGSHSFLMMEAAKFLLSKNKKFLNYEQDLGLPALRFTKNSFRPEFFLKKFAVVKGS